MPSKWALETIIGSLDVDGDDGIMVDDDGQWSFEVGARRVCVREMKGDPREQRRRPL